MSYGPGTDVPHVMRINLNTVRQCRRQHIEESVGSLRGWVLGVQQCLVDVSLCEKVELVGRKGDAMVVKRFCIVLVSFLWVVVCVSPALAREYEGYALTEQSYYSDVDMDAAAVAEFGPGTTVADWTDLRTLYSGQIVEFCDAVGLLLYRSNAWVYLDGQGFYSGERHYFVERHDGSLPGGFLAHDNIDNYALSLGSWYFTSRILVRLPGSPVSESTWGQVKALFM